MRLPVGQGEGEGEGEGASPQAVAAFTNHMPTPLCPCQVGLLDGVLGLLSSGWFVEDSMCMASFLMLITKATADDDFMVRACCAAVVRFCWLLEKAPLRRMWAGCTGRPR